MEIFGRQNKIEEILREIIVMIFTEALKNNTSVAVFLYHVKYKSSKVDETFLMKIIYIDLLEGFILERKR